MDPAPAVYAALDALGIPYERHEHPAVFNAANEECVAAFAEGRLTFLGIVDAVRDVVEAYEGGEAATVEAVEAAEAWARRRARDLISNVG